MVIKLDRKKIYADILFAMLYIGTLIDNFVGYQMRVSRNENLISKAYRLIIFIFLVYIISMSKRKRNSFTVLLIGGMFLPFIHVLTNGTVKGVTTDCLYIIKMLYPIALIYALCVLVNLEHVNIYDIDKYLYIISWIYPLSIIIPYVLGVGFKAYKNSGFSGYYAAGNEISIILSVMFIIQMEYMYKKFSLFSVVGVLIAALSTILTGTKAGLIVVVGGVLCYFFRKDKNVLKKNVYRILAIVIAIIVIYIIVNVLGSELSANIDRLRFKYNQLNNNITNFMFSNRNTEIMPSIKRLVENPIRLFFGEGFYGQIYIYAKNNGLIEMDFFDSLVQNGIFYSLAIWKFYLKNFLYSKDCTRKNYKLAGILMILYSFMAGHTLCSSNTGGVLAVLCVGVMLSSKYKR